LGFEDIFFGNQKQLQMALFHDRNNYPTQLLDKRELSGRKVGQSWQGMKLKA
jgi:hypothetical protein